MTGLYEAQTIAIARQLWAASQESRNFFSQLREQMRIEDKLLSWAMEHPGLRVQLFRLIDCLPSLRSKAEVARHLQEYLSDPSVELPEGLKKLLNFAQPDSLPAQAAATTFTTAVQALAHKYIAGETTEQVLKTIGRLRKQGMLVTMDILGEAVITEAEAQQYCDRYLDLMQQLSPLGQREGVNPVQVSVKLTAFYSQFDPLDVSGCRAKVGEPIRRLLHRAQELGVAVHFDMEQYAYKDITLAILKDILLEPEFRDRADVGLTLQAYLRDSYQDAQDLITWVQQRGTPITVRVVKGAYWDQELIKAVQNDWPLPVYQHKQDTDANFERVIELLLSHHTLLRTAVASHNVRSQARAIAIAQHQHIPPTAMECQVLYGMADKLAKALVEAGQTVRVYCPYGELIPGMAYLIRRLLENTANSSFLRQQLGAVNIDALLAPPEPTADFRAVNVHLTTGKTSTFLNAANSDYARASQREAIQAALIHVHRQLGQTYTPIINSDRVNTLEYSESLNPSQPEEVVGRVGLATIEDAEHAIRAAKAAQAQWQQTPVAERAILLRRAADLLEAQRHELVAWMCYEVGKVVAEGDAEVSEAVDFCRYYADEMERLSSGYDRNFPGETNHYHYQGRGIAVVISPWNFPLAIPTGMTVAALVTGNCTILKPADPAAVVAAKLAEILIAAGFPRGVFQFLPGRGSVIGPYLTKHPDVHLIAFTGSQEVGCRIIAEAAVLQRGQTHIKRVIAEMGGKNAIIIDESADLDQAVAGVVQSAFGYSGQKCSACSRVIVLESIYQPFVQRLVEATKSLNIGPAHLPSTRVGPVVTAAARDRIQEYIAKGQREAELTLSVPVPEVGYFVSPTIFTNVPPTATIAQEEIFGPVLAVLRAETFSQALEIANATAYALTGGLYSRTPSHIQQAKAQFAVGNLYINRGITGAIVDRQPFGGFKLSGIGSKAGGRDYLLQFLEPRVITENVQRQGFAPIAGVDD
ncbi:L-glutamate gamma-semialdehyde dehydrogenase [Thermosynechococcus sp. QKsg1]|uniref:L-glutamate gamma-semialdehyde dehydrogenase n=1 Tax=unclassified Thermosynechococcus TaxID=2622553 RepID=UPI002575FABB|nr:MULTISPECIES: L-glutamate gamma-semialdehyde dehydrogenase [unclassified Thermosynechococcus]WJI24788.1 L-glutamate gamma-semialdehyde dehydrogenase [Thermosynechococcus sp. B0]WJI27304.1 L-glutamate gamma-semialdehyde dehydrogenase [Thermosynechococcus sp. B1]WJI29836.1 L-glutamate gamma-semialdehyde dehydrogenase [Thermosynechococcus sp. B3]WNC51730.1 L-glutamate gamma-semialdehyde dehydrogenase [Thermosynechococcus sp. TG215]WNC56812.1 L-glutamate gamma-semialdehyde dehydrogenase [Thermo